MSAPVSTIHLSRNLSNSVGIRANAVAANTVTLYSISDVLFDALLDT